MMGNISIKKRNTFFTLKLAKKKKSFLGVSMLLEPGNGLSPQLRFFDDIPILSVLRSKKRGVMFFPPQILKVNFFNSLFHLFYKIAFF